MGERGERGRDGGKGEGGGREREGEWEREERVETEGERVSKLVFYAHSTITVISARGTDRQSGRTERERGGGGEKSN